jgi:ribosomal protein S18 acetylase RimI-like enzyme
MALFIGSKLKEKALVFLKDKCKQVELLVVDENLPARSFYESFAFFPTGDQRSIQRYGSELCQLRYERPITLL